MTACEWQLPPDELELPDGVLDVWRAEIADRAQARAILTLLLSRYLGIETETISFVHGPHGKPALSAGGAQQLRFNMSHTGGLALYAFARGVEVGIDVEHPRPNLDPLRMARRFIGGAEAERLRALDPDARTQGFLLAWVRHEATVKCLGTGIAGQPAREEPGAGVGRGGPWIAELDPGAGAAAAVALAAAGGPRQLRCWRWQAAPESGSSPAGP